MKNNITKALMAVALLVAAVPAIASAQVYNRYDRYDRYDRSNRQDVRDAVSRLDRSASRLQAEVNTGDRHRVLGGILSFTTVDNAAIDQVRDFRRAVRNLRAASRGGFDLNNSADEARTVL